VVYAWKKVVYIFFMAAVRAASSRMSVVFHPARILNLSSEEVGMRSAAAVASPSVMATWYLKIKKPLSVVDLVFQYEDEVSWAKKVGNSGESLSRCNMSGAMISSDLVAWVDRMLGMPLDVREMNRALMEGWRAVM
jgi:hypothetical protein